jgi:hypothetical protein
VETSVSCSFHIDRLDLYLHVYLSYNIMKFCFRLGLKLRREMKQMKKRDLQEVFS